MRKLWKILAWTIGALVALTLLLVVGLRLFLPAETLRDLAVARASAALGRDVSVGEVSVSLRGGLGIRLTDVAVGNPPGFPAGRVLAAEGVDLKLRLGPLLHKRLYADRLVIDAPALTLVRLDSLRTNFDFAPASDAGAAPAAGDGTALDVKRLICRGGAIVFRDEITGDGIGLSGLVLDWSIEDAGGGRLITRGETRADSLTVAGDRPLSVGPLSLRHAIHIDTPGERIVLESGSLDVAGLVLSLAGEGTYGGAGPTARIELAGDALSLADLPYPVTDLTARLALGRDTLRVESASARIGGAQLTFTGVASGLARPAEARLEGAVDATADLSTFTDRLPPDRGAVLAGRAAGTLRLAGLIDDPRGLFAGGRITVTDLSYRDDDIFEPLTDLDATLTFDRRDLRIETCRAGFDPSRVSLTGVARGLVTALTDSTARRPHLDFVLDAPLFDLDHLFPGAAPAAAGPSRPPLLPEFPDFTGAGRVTIARLIYGGVAFTGLTGRVEIADRKVTVAEADGAVLGGRVTGRTTVDLADMNDPGYRGAFAATAVRADSLLSRFTPIKGHVFGALDFAGEYSARGLDPAVFKRTLAMDARGAVTQGRLVTTGVVRRGLTTLSGRLGRPFNGEERLQNLAGTVRTAGERVIFDGLTAEIPDLGALSLAGSYGFAGDLDFHGELLLTEAHSSRLLSAGGSGLLDRLRGALGRPERVTPRLKLPVRIGGAFTRPEASVDFGALGRSAGQEVADGLRDQLEGLFR